MKNLLSILILVLASVAANAQLISRFTWETNPVTKAAYGANAISVSSYATISDGGSNESKGLNPGNGQTDINLVLDGTKFNVPAIDISIDFRREESVASFFYRGPNFNFGMNGGNLSVNFYVGNGQGFTAITSGNIYAIPDDHRFHTYHFAYDNNTGVAKVLVNDIAVYTYRGIAGAPLYWTGAGNVIIGKDMDATGKNVAVLDNLIIQQYISSLLPLQLVSFNVASESNNAVIDFSSTHESAANCFVVEKSSNGSSFSPVKSFAAVNGYITINHYQFTDSLPFSPICYYRLKIINNDGSFSYSSIKSLSTAVHTGTIVSVYPNPCVDYVVIKMNNSSAGKFVYTVSSVAGIILSNTAIQLNNGPQQVQINLTKTAARGLIVIKIINTQTGAAEAFSIVRK